MTDPAVFDEEDEPSEKIEAAFERGVKRMAARPATAAPVAFSCNERLQLQGIQGTSTTVAAVVTRTGG